MKKVGIVIVSYNSSDIMENCIIDAIKSCNYAKLKPIVVVVDNNSSDDSVKTCRKVANKVISNKKNLGFAKAVNQGIDYLLGINCDYLLILNPDAILDKNAIKEMSYRLDASLTIGAVGPKMLNSDGSDGSSGYYLKTPNAISVALFSTMLRSYFIKHKWFVSNLYEESPLRDAMFVQQIPGAAIFTSNTKIQHIGKLDEDFAIWFEDVEWCYRARKKGYNLSYCEKAVVFHEGGVTFTKWNSPEKAVTFYVSMKTFFRKNKKMQLPLVLMSLTINSLLVYLKTKDRNNLVFIKKLWLQKKGLLPN